MESVRRARAPRTPTGATRLPAGARKRAAIEPLASQTILGLQASAGNRATAALLGRTRPPGPARMPAQPLLQRVLMAPVFPQPPAWQEELHLFAEAYNTMLPEAANEAARRAKEEKSRSLWAGKPAGRPVARQKALSMLGRVERWVYDWFSTHADRDVLVDPEWAAMRQFLNQIQDERIALVEMDIDDPPLANFAELEKTDQEHVRRIWADLVSEKHWWNKTGIAIEGTKAARVRILADFSRLLETETGRMVVGALSAGPKLTITPKENAKFKASPVEEAREGLLVVAQPLPGEQFAQLDLSGVPVQQRKALLNDVRERNPNARGVSVIMDDVTRHFRFNEGTASTVTVPEGARDTEAKKWSLAIGVNDQAIIATTFVNLGHELGHAFRSLHGITAKQDQTFDTLLAHAFPGLATADRPEEFFNIPAIENRIRHEAGLALRGSHVDWFGRALMQLFDAFHAVKNASERALERAPNPLKPDIARFDSDALQLEDDLMAVLESSSAEPAPIIALATRVAALRQRAAALEARARAGPEPVGLPQ